MTWPERHRSSTKSSVCQPGSLCVDVRALQRLHFLSHDTAKQVVLCSHMCSSRLSSEGGRFWACPLAPVTCSKSSDDITLAFSQRRVPPCDKLCVNQEHSTRSCLSLPALGRKRQALCLLITWLDCPWFYFYFFQSSKGQCFCYMENFDCLGSCLLLKNMQLRALEVATLEHCRSCVHTNSVDVAELAACCVLYCLRSWQSMRLYNSGSRGNLLRSALYQGCALVHFIVFCFKNTHVTVCKVW